MVKMLGFNDMILTIEKCTGTDLRGIPTYAPPITKQGFMVEKTTYNYATGEMGTYMSITLHEPNLVQKEDKVCGYRVETVKDVYLHGQFLVCEVSAK